MNAELKTIWSQSQHDVDARRTIALVAEGRFIRERRLREFGIDE